MDLDQLATALAAHDASPDAVLSALHAKRRRRARNRRLALGGGVTAIAVAIVAMFQPWTAPSAVTAPPSAASGCAVTPLADMIATIRQKGASVIVGNGSLTGKTATDSEVYSEMRLRSVRTLSGPSVAAGSTGWVSGARGPTGPAPGADAGALWAPDGDLFAIVWSARQVGATIGPILRVAPIVNDQVIFSAAGCWGFTDVATQPYHGPLAEIPGSDSYARAARRGFRAVPLATVEHLLNR